MTSLFIKSCLVSTMEEVGMVRDMMCEAFDNLITEVFHSINYF